MNSVEERLKILKNKRDALLKEKETIKNQYLFLEQEEKAINDIYKEIDNANSKTLKRYYILIFILFIGSNALVINTNISSSILLTTFTLPIAYFLVANKIKSNIFKKHGVTDEELFERLCDIEEKKKENDKVYSINYNKLVKLNIVINQIEIILDKINESNNAVFINEYSNTLNDENIRKLKK